MSKSLFKSFNVCQQTSTGVLRVPCKYTQTSILTGRHSRHVHQRTRGLELINSKKSRTHASIMEAANTFPRNTSFSPHSYIPSANSITTRMLYGTLTTDTEPAIHNIFEPTSGTWQYVVADHSTLNAVIIDPVLNFDSSTQAITTHSAESLLSLIKEKNYRIENILETHAHADHLSAASYLQTRLQDQDHKPPICIGKRIEQVQTLFAQRYGVPKHEYRQVFDRLFDDDETFTIGNLKAKAIHLPGHTPDHLGYLIGGKFHPKLCSKSIY
jgi:hypothetical protein